MYIDNFFNTIYYICVYIDYAKWGYSQIIQQPACFQKNKNWLSKVQKIATQSWQNLETEWNYQNIMGNVCFTHFPVSVPKPETNKQKKHTHNTLRQGTKCHKKRVLLLLGHIYSVEMTFFLPLHGSKKKHSRNHLLQSEAPPRGPPWWMEVGWLVTWLMKGRKKKMGVN